MRLLFALLTLALSTAVCSMVQPRDVRLIGVWELVSADYGNGTPALDNKEVKFISKSRFVWVRYDKAGNTAGEGGGTYTFSGSAMTEHLDYIDKRESFLKDKDQTVMITFQGEEVFISSGTLTNGQHITEVWKRVD